MLNFSLDSTIKEQTGGRIFPVGIIGGNIVKDAAYVSEYEAIDVIFYNVENEYEYRERIFKPSENSPYNTPEEELLKTQRKLKHILNRFMSDEESAIVAISWKDLALKFVDKLLEKSKDVEVELKFIWNKNFEFPSLGNIRFIRTADEDALFYSKWEKENRLTVPESSPVLNSGVTVSEADGDEIF
jgi:hypothetical protein